MDGLRDNGIQYVLCAMVRTVAWAACGASAAAQTVGNPDSEIQSCEAGILKAQVPAFVDWFGWAVAADGPLAVISIRGDDEHGPLAGSAEVFRLTGTRWVHEAQLTASDGLTLDEFGSAVSISGDTLVVGAWRHDERADNAGAAYVYRRTAGGWVEEAKLLASDGAAGDAFGWSAAVYGDRIAIGAYEDDDAGLRSGAAYVFRRTDGAWIEEQRLTAAEPAAGDQFGISVGLGPKWLAVGAPGADGPFRESGAVFVFEQVEGRWALRMRLGASDASRSDGLGGSVALQDDSIMVGASGFRDTGENRGAAYLFQFSSETFQQVAKFPTGPRRAGDRSGGVALKGSIAAVAVWNEQETTASLGAVHVFHFDGMGWQPGPRVTALDSMPDDRFGNSIAVGPTGLLIGAYYDDEPYHSGSVYSFQIDDAARVDLQDERSFQLCFRGAEEKVDDPCCRRFDFDSDDDVDEIDASELHARMSGP